MPRIGTFKFQGLKTATSKNIRTPKRTRHVNLNRYKTTNEIYLLKVRHVTQELRVRLRVLQLIQLLRLLQQLQLSAKTTRGTNGATATKVTTATMGTTATTGTNGTTAT